MSSTARGTQLLDAVRLHLETTAGRLVLAVSGGGDSMALLHAVHEVAAERIAAVATFDHGTGAAARAAAELVRERGALLGLRVIMGEQPGAARAAVASEARWREARWRFLREVSARYRARVVTAHNRDDQVETVLMRILRASGARGLAALYARSSVLRPLLAVSREEIRRWSEQLGVPFVDDPTNASRAYLRNRVRLDLLPALRRVRPAIDDELLDLSRRAAHVRSQTDAVAAALSEVVAPGCLTVAALQLTGYSRESLASLWPALAARIGVTLDRRGTERLAAFTTEGSVGTRVQLSGGWEAYRLRNRFEIRRAVAPVQRLRRLDGATPVKLGAWRFRPVARSGKDPWTATLGADTVSLVRSWRAGDRMQAVGARGPRRVKRFLSDAGIVGPLRARWPVVVSDGTVVWIPGVCRSEAATARPGRPEVSYACEFNAGG